MTWIIIIVLIVIIFFVVSNQNHKKEVQNHFIQQGGLRKSYPTFTNHLENFYEMEFLNDTGSSFSYSKKIRDTNSNLGQLIIGAKIDMTDNIKLFSKFVNHSKTTFSGLDVTGVNFEDITSIEKCINISIDKLKSNGTIPYENKKSFVTKSNASQDLIDEWKKINREENGEKVSDELEIYINDFFVPDMIDPIKFMINHQILNMPYGFYDGSEGTKSMEIEKSYIPPLFDKFFIGAYPDVYEWFQDNQSKGVIKIVNEIEKLPEDEQVKHLRTPHLKKGLYRAMINQYKEEVAELETKK